MISPETQIKVLIVDDEEIVRYGLKAILQAEPTIAAVSEAGDGESAIAKATSIRPDVVLMDINMPVMNGIAATREICQTLPQTKVIVLTTHLEDHYLFGALSEGATGYLLKNTPPEDLIDSIHSIHKGYFQVSPSLGQKLCQQFESVVSNSASEAASGGSHKLASAQTARSSLAYQQNSPKPIAPPNATQNTTPNITPREQDVLNLIAEGASNREIAQILHIAEKTVKNHVSSLLRRVGLRDRTQLAIWANGLSQSDMAS